MAEERFFTIKDTLARTFGMGGGNVHVTGKIKNAELYLMGEINPMKVRKLHMFNGSKLRKPPKMI